MLWCAFRCLSYWPTGLVLLDQSGAEQQAALRVFYAYHSIRSPSGQSNGRDCAAHGLELHLHHIRGKQLRHQGNYSVVISLANQILFNIHSKPPHITAHAFGPTYAPQCQKRTPTYSQSYTTHVYCQQTTRFCIIREWLVGWCMLKSLRTSPRNQQTWFPHTRKPNTEVYHLSPSPPCKRAAPLRLACRIWTSALRAPCDDEGWLGDRISYVRVCACDHVCFTVTRNGLGHLLCAVISQNKYTRSNAKP